MSQSLTLILILSLFILIDIISCNFDCSNRHCCTPRLIKENIQGSFDINCNTLGLGDCMMNNDICNWDCMPIHTQERDNALNNAGYVIKTFRGLSKGDGQYLDPSFVGQDPPPSPHEEPTNIDEVIQFTKLVTVDECGIEYEYEMDTIAASVELDRLKQKEQERNNARNQQRQNNEDSNRRDDDTDTDTNDERDGEQRLISSDSDRSADFNRNFNRNGRNFENRNDIEERRRGLSDLIRRLTIFGTDGRTQILNELELQFAGYLQFQTSGGVQKRCSASLISPKWIITAAHCVHNGRGSILGQWYSNWRFYPGLVSASQLRSLEIQSIQAWTFGEWTNSGVFSLNWDYDIAWIELNVVDTGIGYLHVGFDTTLPDHTQFNIVGYPGDQPWLTRWHQFCPWEILTEEIMYTESCDITGGSSGSPVYMFSSTGQRVVHCIVSWENSVYNGCARITQSKYDSICSSIGICDE